MCQPCFSLSHSRLTIPFAPLRRPTCSAYPPSSLFSSLLSQKLCTPLHASLLTSTSTSWPSVSMARTGTLACRIRGRLVSVVQKSGYPFLFLSRSTHTHLPYVSSSTSQLSWMVHWLLPTLLSSPSLHNLPNRLQSFLRLTGRVGRLRARSFLHPFDMYHAGRTLHCIATLPAETPSIIF